MEARKKYTIIVVSLVIALILSLTAMIIVLVVANQNATSAVNVKYTASEVYVELSANAYFANTTTAFTNNGSPTGSPTIELSPDNTTGALSQPNSTTSIDLNKNNQTIVFEYIFKNMTDDVNCKIELTALPATQDNINLTYYYSNTKMDNPLNLTGETNRVAQLLNAYAGETTYKYIYIIASIDNLLYDASLEGDFAWGLSKPKVNDTTTYILNLSADYVERDSTSYFSTSAVDTIEVTTLSNTTLTIDDIDVYPAKANYAFIGWSYSDGGDVIATSYVGEESITTNKVSALTSTTLYPVFKQGSIPASSYSYSNGSYIIANTKLTTTIVDFIIPDIYNDGINGIAKVTTITAGDSASGVLNGNTSVTSLTLGRYITNIGKYSFCDTTMLTTINFNCIDVEDLTVYNYVFYKAGADASGITLNIDKSVIRLANGLFSPAATSSHLLKIITVNFEDNSRCESIGDSTFRYCKSITDIAIPSSVKSIGNFAFGDCTSLSSIIIPNSVTAIGEHAFNYCVDLTSISISNCLTTIVNHVFSNCTKLENVIIPSSVTSIGTSAFYGCRKLSYIYIPSSVTMIMENAFEGINTTTDISIVIDGINSWAYYDISANVISTNVELNEMHISTNSSGYYIR